MAKATVKYKEVVQPIESVTLTINREELGVLITILNRIGGCPDNSPRKHAANIMEALIDATKNIRSNSNLPEWHELVEDFGKHAAIYFKDYPDAVNKK